MKGDDLYQKAREIWYFLYIRVGATDMTYPPLLKKQRCPCSGKMHLRVTSLASPKKMIFILKDMVFLLKYLTDTLERAQEAATGNVTQGKVFLEILQNSQEKTYPRASFLMRLQT